MSARCAPRLMIAVCLLIAAQTSAFNAGSERSVAYRKIISMNKGWKFYKGTPSGTPSSSGYSDASWTSVCVPHSVDYTDPATSESYYEGEVWYRKTFTVSSTAKKAFLEFEGAMQVANVWLNGTKVGTHDASGYTSFSFDVSSLINLSGTNVLAVSLDNSLSNDIPPGVAQPDYYLYSGLYRDVWLVLADNVSIPYCGQRISTPSVSATSATADVKTSVMNASAQAQNVTVEISLRDSTGAVLQTKSATQSIAAGATAVFDITTDAVSSPHLWSPETPYLYTMYTRVSTGSTVCDDFFEKFGFRYFSWSATNGFSLNGSRYQIRGTCTHQTYGWVCNALPNSRYWKEVELMRSIGVNSIRCAHYPRDPQFYNACDRLGMLVFVEVPTWGYETMSYSTLFWGRWMQCGKEMISQGYNHPSIMAWGEFNEPTADFATHFKQLRDTMHVLDPARPTYFAQQPDYLVPNNATGTDLCGLNYMTTSSLPNPVVGTEYHLDVVPRGDAYEPTFTLGLWSDWQAVVSAGPRLAGGHFWSFHDYNSYRGDGFFGVVDKIRVPKNSFFFLRQKWLGTAVDSALSGTATRIEVKSDMDSLLADSTDIAQVMLTLRDASRKCIDAQKQLTVAVSGPADMFGSAQVTTIKGRIAVIIKSKLTAGTITVTASATGLTGSTTIRAVSDNGGATVMQSPSASRTAQSTYLTIDMSRSISRVNLAVSPMDAGRHAQAGLYDTRGRLVAAVFDGPLSAGAHSIALGRPLTSGRYIARMSICDAVYSSAAAVVR